MINPNARRAVYARSFGICERCHERDAVHVHHLTYIRAGHERPEDLQHICIVCHCMQHPEKAPEIFTWETERQKRIANSPGKYERETEEERDRLDYREREEEQEREQEHEQEQEREEPALNLGGYTASAYCIEEVEQEEFRNAV